MQPWLAAPRQGLSEAAVREALSYERGANVRHGVDVLTMTDALTPERLRFEGGSVAWSYRAPDRVVGQSDNIAAVRLQGTLTVPADHGLNLNARRLRLWTEVQMLDGEWARFYRGVFEVVNPGAKVDDGMIVRQTLTLADKSYRWANSTLTEPLVLPGSTVVIDWLKADLAARFGESRFALASSTATLGQGRTFERGESWLAVYSSLLEAIGYDHLTADESGAPAAQSLATLAGKGIEHTYGAGEGKILTAGQMEPLLPTLPNVIRFSARQGPSLGNVEGNGLRTVRNEATGPASIAARGGVEVELRVDVDTDTQTALDAVAAADSARYFAGGGLTFTGQVALNPRHGNRDVIGINLPRLGTGGGAWLVTGWSSTFGGPTSEANALMSVTAERKVSL